MKSGELIIHENATIRIRNGKKIYISVTLQRKNGQIGGKLLPENRDRTLLKKFLLMNHI